MAVALALPAVAPAAAADRTLVPGRMGFNALPTVPVADPQVGDELQLEVSAAAQASELPAAADAALVPYLRLSLPFRRIAALEVDVVPVELWRVGPATQQRLGAVHASGASKGDLRFGARFTLLPEGGWSPALGLRLLVKTSTGKSPEDRRFLDAPAYGADGLVGKTLPWRAGPFTVRVVAGLGFFVWQQGPAWQDDALTAGVRLELLAERGTRLGLEWRGYWGYEEGDKPMVLGVSAGQRVSGPLELIAAVNRGLGPDAPPWELRLGAVLHWDVRELPLVGEWLADGRERSSSRPP